MGWRSISKVTKNAEGSNYKVLTFDMLFLEIFHLTMQTSWLKFHIINLYNLGMVFFKELHTITVVVPGNISSFQCETN